MKFKYKILIISTLTSVLFISAMVGTLFYLSSPPKFNFMEHVIESNFNAVNHITNVDLNGDNNQDILACGYYANDIAWFFPHQANIRIIQATAKRINLPMEKVYVSVDRYGNTSAASIPISIAEAEERGLLRQGDFMLLAAFGGGLTWGSAIIRW